MPETPLVSSAPGYAFHIEEWTNQCDFAFFDNSYELNQSSEHENIYACAASSAVKQKFRFPSKDPEENSISDERTDVQKVNDILVPNSHPSRTDIMERSS